MRESSTIPSSGKLFGFQNAQEAPLKVGLSVVEMQQAVLSSWLERVYWSPKKKNWHNYFKQI